MMTWIVILIMYHGVSTKVITMHGNAVECHSRLLFEKRFDPMVQFTICVPWQGDEA